MLQFVPALSLLGAFMVISLVLLSKVKTEQVPALLEAKNVLLLFASGLFCVLLVVHLFKEQAWTADLLKVVAGVLAGAVATLTAASKDKAKDSLAQTAIGNDIQQAGRDINNVKKLVGDLKQVTDSVINQYQTVERSVAKLSAEATAHVVKQEYFHIDIPVPDDRFYSDVKEIDSQKPSFVDAEATRRHLNRRFELFLTVPGARDEIRRNIQNIQDAGWRVRELSMDIAPKMVNVGFRCEWRGPIDELLAAR
jgi:hypothetical protein